MLRTRCVQLFHNSGDASMEDPLYEPDPVRRFAGLNASIIEAPSPAKNRA